MPSIEEQNLTEFLAEVKLKMENITFSKQKDIQKINDFIFSSDGKYVRSKIIFLYGHRIGLNIKTFRAGINNRINSSFDPCS